MLWPLQGRSRELEALHAMLADDAAGGAVVVAGAGVGKTRLAQEVSRAAEADGLVVSWVRATRSAATIPLGAFAALLPAAAPGADADLLARAREALRERAGGRRIVLCVDDAHLLDGASAALVHQLVALHGAFVVATVRRGEPAPDALQALWKDELCTLVELGELTRADAGHLVEAALGGPVDGRTAGALWELTRGNALFLRELVLHGTDRGLLTDDHGVWRWRGEVGAGLRLAELVEVRLEALTAAERAVLEVVAIGAPLELGLLAPAELESLAGLEAREVVERRVDGRRRWVDLAHPLHGEVVRRRLAATRLDAIRRRLADAVQARGARRRGDLMRVATWRLEAGGDADAALFERAAAAALAGQDAALSERFARAAVRACDGFGVRLALGRALAAAGRAEEAEALLVALGPQAGDDDERTALALVVARNRFWALDRAEDADATLRQAEATVAAQGRRDELLALRIRLMAARGRPREALALAEPLLIDPGVSERARVQAAVAAGEALLSSGRIAEALDVVDTWSPRARAHRLELPVAERVLRSERTFALRFAGRLVEATASAEQTYALAVERASPYTTAVEAAQLGFVWLARGRVRSALRSLQEGAALLRDVDAIGMLPWALAGVVQAAAQAGEREVARRALAEMEDRPLGHQAFASEPLLARAWASAAAGELSAARRHARAAADVALEPGQDAMAARALHELCRLGGAGSAAAELARLARHVEGAFAATAARHAAALVARDGTALRDAAEDFAAQDALLVAAEAAEAAATAFSDEGREASARTARARSALWLGLCEGAGPPTLLGRTADELTPREREVALLAASGLTSPEIAGRLVVSVRTVDNHLLRAYRKLGVSRREELAGALTHPGPPPG